MSYDPDRPQYPGEQLPWDPPRCQGCGQEYDDLLDQDCGLCDECKLEREEEEEE